MYFMSSYIHVLLIGLKQSLLLFHVWFLSTFLVNDVTNISCEITLRRMPQNLIYNGC